MRRILTAIAAGSALAGCLQHHAAALPDSRATPRDAPTEHTSRLWLDVDAATPSRQCSRTEGRLPVCFDRVDAATISALERVLGASFRSVAQRTRDDDLEPKDYVLHVRLRVRAARAATDEFGHAVLVEGGWQLVRDGFPVAGEAVSARSRAGLAYGPRLAVGASEALDAVALRIGDRVRAVPETDPEPTRRLPPVVTSASFGPAPPITGRTAR